MSSSQTNFSEIKQNFCRTKIICTLGPACDNEVILEQMIREGLDGGRFNFSHGNYKEHKERLERFRRVEEKCGLKLPTILDTKGPEIRLGSFKEPVVLYQNQQYILTTRDNIIGTKEIASVSHKGITKDVKVGDRILIDDGLVELEALKITETDIICKVQNTGKINSNKGINLPDSKTSLPSLTEKDINDLKFACDNNFDFIAGSFIRSKEDCINIKKFLFQFGGPQIKLISKIENQEGIDNFDEILSVSDGIMVARGDLGVEIPLERVPIEQKNMIRKCNEAGKLVITATQMLDSMIVNPRPTRAEVTDIANSIIDGTSVIMLSGETAAGKHPVETVHYMNQIALETEKSLNLNKLSVDLDEIKTLNLDKEDDYRNCINYSCCVTANLMKAKGIICVSSNDKAAMCLSKFRPKSPIFCITNNEQAARHLSLEWNVQPVYVQNENRFNILIDEGIKKFKKMGFLTPGDNVVICGEDNKDTTNIKTGSTNVSQLVGGILKVK